MGGSAVEVGSVISMADGPAALSIVPYDSVDEATDEVQRLLNEGFYVCPSAFPAVPVNCPGVRFTITLHNELEDIDALIAAASSGVHIALPALTPGLQSAPSSHTLCEVREPRGGLL